MDNSNIIKEDIYFDTIDSTQLYARKYIEERHPQHWVLIRADEQIAGIGRYDRKWVSPKCDNIYLTLIIPSDMKTFATFVPFLPILTCAAISQTLESFGFDTKIKWVNDVLLDENKKVSGTLIESIIEGDSLYVLIGIG